MISDEARDDARAASPCHDDAPAQQTLHARQFLASFAYGISRLHFSRRDFRAPVSAISAAWPVYFRQLHMEDDNYLKVMLMF